MNANMNKVQITPEEQQEFLAWKANKERQERAAQDRETYKQLVDNVLEELLPVLSDLSQQISYTKTHILETMNEVLNMKSEVMQLTRDNQKSHTFTHSEGHIRLTLGVYTTDAYRDTVEDGIQMVQDYIESLAQDAKSKSLVKMVLRLLARDSMGTLKASRVVQLRKIAEESGNERFMEGVRIIEESYQPAVSKQFVRGEYKDKIGAWRPIPLSMTEAEQIS